MGKLFGGIAALILLPVLIVVLVAGVDTPPPPAASRGGALKPGVIPAAYLGIVNRAAATCPQLTPALLAAQIQTESNWQTAAASPAGAQGIAGFMPDGWAVYGRDENGDGQANILDPADAIPAAARLDCDLLRQVAGIPGDPLNLMLAAYNAGLGAVRAAGGIPPFPETQAYVPKVRDLATSFTAAPTVAGPGGGVTGTWAPGVAPLVHLLAARFHITAATYAEHHPDGGHAVDLAYQQFGADWDDGAPGVAGTGPQWQIAQWIADNLVDTGNAWYVGHHASIHYHGDPPGTWRVAHSQAGSSDPTYAHMNHIHVSWPRWYGQAGPSTFAPAYNASDPDPWLPGPLPGARRPLLRRRRRRPPFSLRASRRRHPRRPHPRAILAMPRRSAAQRRRRASPPDPELLEKRAPWACS